MNKVLVDSSEWIQEVFGSNRRLRAYMFEPEQFPQDELVMLSHRLLEMGAKYCAHEQYVLALEVLALCKRECLSAEDAEYRQKLIDTALAKVELEKIEHLPSWVKCRWKSFRAKPNVAYIVDYGNGSIMLRSRERGWWNVYLKVKGVWKLVGEVNLHQRSRYTLRHKVIQHSEDDYTVIIFARKNAKIDIYHKPYQDKKEVSISDYHHPA